MEHHRRGRRTNHPIHKKNWNRKEQRPRGQTRNTARGREKREPQQPKGQEVQKQLQTETGQRPTDTKARKIREKTPEYTKGPENPAPETETRDKPRVESRRKYTRRAERQDPEVTASTSERRKLQMTRIGKEEPRTS